MEQQLKQSSLILLFGRICSGKGTYPLTGRRISVSAIVRNLTGPGTRSDLQNTRSLDSLIANTIVSDIHRLEGLEHCDDIIVDGIRQLSIVEKVLKHFPDALLVWLEVPTEERKRRYEARKDGRDTEPFEVADNRPIELECQKIYETYKDRLVIVDNS